MSAYNICHIFHLQAASVGQKIHYVSCLVAKTSCLAMQILRPVYSVLPTSDVTRMHDVWLTACVVVVEVGEGGIIWIHALGDLSFIRRNPQALLLS